MLKRFVRDTSGNFAIMFAVCLTMVMAVVGAAIDLNGMTSQRSTYQNMADAAVLAAARSGETDLAKLNEIASAFVAANGVVGETYATDVTISADGVLHVEVSGTYTTVLMGMFGKPTIDIEGIAEAPTASADPVDIVLVLDTTGSMSGTKITSLKTAAKGLITQLESYENEDIRVAVVPFRDYVNVGVSNRDKAWLDVEGDSSVTQPERCYMRRDVISRTNCRTVTSTCSNDGVSYECQRTQCDYTYGEPYEYCYTPTSTTAWHGCVGSRNQPWNLRAQYRSRPMPGIMNVWCGQQVLPLTSNMTTVKSKLNSLDTGRATYMPSGLIWGWRMIHRSKPFTQSRTSDGKEKIRVMIFMTDGGNTTSQNGIHHSGGDADAANERSKKLCNRIKRDKIKLYTVAYEFDGANTIRLLKNCASEPAMFFLAKDGEALQKAFKDIGSSLIKLRLTH